MKVKLLDTETGNTVESEGISTFSWTENNYSCDCNRELLFGNDTNSGYCLKCNRYIVIEASVELDIDYPATLEELNQDYPKDLLRKYGILATNDEQSNMEV